MCVVPVQISHSAVNSTGGTPRTSQNEPVSVVSDTTTTTPVASSSTESGMRPAGDPGSHSAPESLFPHVQTESEPATIPPPSGSPSTPPAGIERIELLPEVDQKLRRIADAIGLGPREVLGHLLKHASQQIRRGAASEPPADGTEAGRPAGTTMILRRIPVGPVDNRRLRAWQDNTGRSPSLLVEQRITTLYGRLSTGRLDDTTTENPLDAYQLFLEVLHTPVDSHASTNGSA